MVSVSGPRVGVIVYRLHLAVQLLVLALIFPAVLATVALRDWRYLLLVPGLLVLYWFVGVMGAAGLWELANMTAIGSAHCTHTFPISSVKRVRIGPGWARNGLWLVISPYLAGINKMSEDHAVSFEAPAGDIPGDGVYALRTQSADDVRELAGVLSGE
jgi:hypothetical protein